MNASGPPDPTPHSTPDLAGLRILVVEDVGVIAMEVKRMLEGLHCAVVGPEPTLARGLRAATGEALDGALLDVNLAGHLSYPIAEELGRRGIPFIFVSGYGADNLDERFRDHPMLEKPFTQEQVASAVERFLPATARDRD